jgi:hypothetical protein
MLRSSLPADRSKFDASMGQNAAGSAASITCDDGEQFVAGIAFN